MGLRDNDVTRMTRHQLAARIEQMEATAHRNCTVGAPRDRHRQGEDIRRREKIADYKAELERRERADAAQAAADARLAANEAARSADADARTAAVQHARFLHPTCVECAETGRTAYAIADLKTDRPLCAKHGAQAAAARARDAAIDRERDYEEDTIENRTPTPLQTAMAAGKEEYARAIAESQPSDPEATCPFDRAKEPMRFYGPNEDTSQQWQERQERADAQAEAQERASTNNAGYETLQPRIQPIRPPADIADPFALAKSPQIAVACPACNAPAGARCHNYKGQNCHPHGERTKLYRSQQPKRGPETPDPAHIAQAEADARDASAHRAAIVATAAAITTARPSPTPDQAKQDAEDLAADAEALVRRHGCGTAIDAIWEAAHRLFHPVTAEQLAKTKAS
jgi:hypothetical protein